MVYSLGSSFLVSQERFLNINVHVTSSLADESCACRQKKDIAEQNLKESECLKEFIDVKR